MVPNNSNPNSATAVDAVLADGEPVHFQNGGSGWYAAYWINGAWSQNTDPRHDLIVKLSTDGTNWYLTDSEDTVNQYDSTGKLFTITHRDGYKQTLTYADCSGYISMSCNTAVSDSEGRQITIQYAPGTGLASAMIDSAQDKTQYFYYSPLGNEQPPSGNYGVFLLQQVVYPDTTSKTYAYTDSVNHFALTGVTDEDNNSYASWTYDGTTGQALSSQNAGGANLTSIQYNETANPPTLTVTNPLGKQFLYTLNTFQGNYQVASIEGLASAHTADSTTYYQYDTNGFVQQLTTGQGRETYYLNDQLGRVTKETDGY